MQNTPSVQVPTNNLAQNEEYEGKAKIIRVLDEQTVLVKFKDDLTAFDGVKKATKKGKGHLNAQITKILFSYLQDKGIPTHFLEQLDDTTFRARKLRMIPVEFVIRNYSAGSFVRRYGLSKGMKLKKPILELFVKSDALHDPLIDPNVAIELGFLTRDEYEKGKLYSYLINDFLSQLFDQIGLTLVDFKLEFGIDQEGTLYLGDELSPDSMRLWKKGTQKSFDKDVFREDKGEVIEAYEYVYRRLSEINDFQPSPPEFMINLSIRLKPGIVDAEGAVVKRALTRLGLTQLSEARVGKLIDLKLSATNVLKSLETFAVGRTEFLINPLIEKSEISFDV